MTRAVRALYWLVPIAFCVYLYWLGLWIWFTQDDFAWLGLRIHVTDFRSFLWAMFHPLAQGSIRPWSERGFFMLFSSFFGLRALPYRLFVFLNQFLNIVLVMMVTRRLTRSELAAFVAPLLWLASPALLVPMSWTASYNEIQCTTFVLLGFYLFIRYTETGERKYYWAQWAVFVLGFGSNEINAVYPAIVALYAIFFAPRCVLSTLPMFGVSAIYAIIHRMAAGDIAGHFYYDMNFHVRSLLKILIRYWNIALTPGRMGVILLTAAILGFVAWQTWKRRWLPLFCLCWFVIILGPLLPLSNHVTEYYLTIPAIGLAILGAYSISLAWRQGWLPAAATTALLLLYMIPASRLARAQMVPIFDGTDRVRALVQSVAYAKRIHPGKAILLRNVDNDLFWSAVYPGPFRIFGWNDVFVMPDNRPLIHDDPNLGAIDNFFLTQTAVAHAVREGEAVVYAVEGRKLRNVTQRYTALMESLPPPPLSQKVDAGVSYYKDQLGEGWYGLESGFRWSTGHAAVFLAGPDKPGQRLYLRGRALDVELEAGPLHMDVTIDGQAQPRQTTPPPC